MVCTDAVDFPTANGSTKLRPYRIVRVQFRDGVRLRAIPSRFADVLTCLAKQELQYGRVDEAAELYEKSVTTDHADGTRSQFWAIWVFEILLGRG
jgi:hypothetical protein